MLALSDRAFRRHVEAMCYATLHETDGWAPMPEDRYTRELIAAGLRTEEGHVYGWLKRQRSKADVDAKRNAGRNAARIRWRNGKGNAEPNAEVEVEREVEEPTTRAFARFWTAYPRKVGKRTALAAFDRAARRAQPSVIADGAERYRDDPNREDAFTAHPTTWLNRDGWEDAPLPAKSNGRAARGANPNLKQLSAQLRGEA